MKKQTLLPFLLFIILPYSITNSQPTEQFNLDKFMHEFRFEQKLKDNRHRDLGKIEWTLAKGRIGLDPILDGLKFNFDIDKDIYLNKDNKNKVADGWDTKFQLEKKYDWGKFRFFHLEYDQYNETGYNGETYSYRFGPIWGFLGGDLETTISYDKGHNNGTKSSSSQFGIDINYYRYFNLYSGDNGSLSFELPLSHDIRRTNHSGYKYHKDGDYLLLEYEPILTYKTPKFARAWQGYIQLYNDFIYSSDETGYYNSFEAEIGVKGKFKTKDVTIEPYISYEFFDKETNKGQFWGSEEKQTNNGDNEISVGVKFKFNLE